MKTRSQTNTTTFLDTVLRRAMLLMPGHRVVIGQATVIPSMNLLECPVAARGIQSKCRSIIRAHPRRLRPAWVLLALVPWLPLAATGAQQGDFVYQPSGGGAVITAYVGPSGAVVIPDSLGGLPVTTIGNSVFKNLTNLTGITIPNSVTAIWETAFQRCTGLKSVVIPDSVTALGQAAFVDCAGLTNITIGSSVTYMGYSGTFARCTGLTRVTIPDSVTALGDGVFSGCTGLKTVTIGKSVTYIGTSALAFCTSLTSITIPSSVTSIGYYAFEGCTGLTNVVIPNSVTYIGEQAFDGCTGLTAFPIPNSVTSIGYYAFVDCTGLTSFTIPNSVTSLGEGVFARCTGLTNVTIGNGITGIGEEVFIACTGLTSITIPNSVTYLGNNLFEGCTSLTNVSMGNSVTTIGDNAFAYCTSLTSVSMGNSVTNIWESAFAHCTGLTSITLPNSVTFIDKNAFSYCPGLTSLYFEGNEPLHFPDRDEVFDGTPFVTAFYRSGAMGWGPTFRGRPTALWVERPSYADWGVSTGLIAQFPAASGAGDDADGDGFTNGDEWFAGSDPTQSASRLELELTPRLADLTASDQTPIPAGQRAVYFRSVPDHYYGVQSTTDLSGAWTLLAVRIASTTQTRFVLPAGGSQIFYRVLALP